MKHGRLFSKNLRVYGHGETATVDSLAQAKEWIKRKGWTRGTIQKVNAYYYVDAEGKERGDKPLVWIDQGSKRAYNVTKRGAFKWGE